MCCTISPCWRWGCWCCRWAGAEPVSVLAIWCRRRWCRWWRIGGWCGRGGCRGCWWGWRGVQREGRVRKARIAPAQQLRSCGSSPQKVLVQQPPIPRSPFLLLARYTSLPFVPSLSSPPTADHLHASLSPPGRRSAITFVCAANSRFRAFTPRLINPPSSPLPSFPPLLRAILDQRHIQQPFQHLRLLRPGDRVPPRHHEAGHPVDPQPMRPEVVGMHRLHLRHRRQEAPRRAASSPSRPAIAASTAVSPISAPSMK